MLTGLCQVQNGKVEVVYSVLIWRRMLSIFWANFHLSSCAAFFIIFIWLGTVEPSIPVLIEFEIMDKDKLVAKTFGRCRTK